jgi:hypothetical protein
VAEKLAEQHQLREVAILFIIGAAAQVLVAFLNKLASWLCYYGEAYEPFESRVLPRYHGRLS